MKLRYGFIGLAVMIGAILVPSIATSENQTQTLCDEYHQLQHEDITAIFTAFRGDDDMNMASALLRARTPSGKMPDATARRFAMAQDFVKTDEAAITRRTRLAEMKTYSAVETCSALQSSAFMQIAPLTE